MGIMDFFSQEAGQGRRKWLDGQTQDVLEALQFYAGPSVDVESTAGLLSMFNPVQDVGEAMRDTRDGDYIGAAANTLSALAPVGAYKLAGAGATDDIANVLQDTLMGFGMKAEGAADAGRRFAADEFGGAGPGKQGIRAYHGSPHSFDRFSMDAIGTGEGAQDLGQGMHFYDEEVPAMLYRNPGARHGDIQAMQRYNEMGDGSVYEVNINARPDQFLDVASPAADLPQGSRMAARRDAKIAAESDPEYRKVMQEHMRVSNVMDGAEKDMLADGFVGFKRKRFGGETEMSVFDENLIEIVKKYGIAGAAAMLGVSAADVEDAINGS